MANKIKMDFYVERALAQKYSSGFLIARGFIMLLPLLYFTYIAYSYNYYTGAYYEADERIASLQEQIDKYQRELKNNKIIIIDSDTGEIILKRGFFYDGETVFCDTVEIFFDAGTKEKVDKFKEGMAWGVKKIKTDERAIIGGLFAAASESGDEGTISNLHLDFTLKKIDFQLKCQKREALDKLIFNLRGYHWAEQVFISSLKSSNGYLGAYIIISLKEADIFE